MTTIERFVRDTADHVMEIFRDEGVYRHIRFRKPGTMCMHFDLITWPGYLCYTGDMGTYVFRRLEDMFQFFRLSEYYAGKPTSNGVLDRIDRRYWAEKLEASDKGDGHTEFDPAAFRREITRQRRRLLVENGREMSQDERHDFWQSLEEVKNEANDVVHYEGRCFTAAQDWRFDFYPRGSVMRRQRILYLDLSDFPSCRTYTFRFEWCCLALRWAIMKYDAERAQQR